MKNGQATPAARQAQVSIFPATFNLFFLLVARASYRFWGLVAFVLVVSAVTISTSQIAPTLQKNFSTLDHLAVPFSIQTIESPKARQVSETNIFEAEGLVQTPTGIVPFLKKFTVFATSYDKNCQGCNATTASGLPTGFGVVAVDPKVISLGTRLYIPGYGVAIAGDTGSAIKGNKIDLGFDNIKTGWWSARFVEVYILR